MSRFFFRKSLLRTTGIIVVLVEAAVFALLGVVSVGILAADMEASLENRAKLPGLLMGRHLLRYESVSEADVMTSLAGEEFLGGVVVDPDGQIHFATEEGLVGQYLSTLDHPLFQQMSSLQDAEQGGTILDAAPGAGALVCLTPIQAFPEATPYYLLVAVDRSKSIQVQRNVATGFIVGGACCIVLTSLGLLTIFSRGVVAPLSLLEKRANSVAEGDLEGEIDTSRQDEIGRLAQSFVTMRDSIRTRVAELETENTKLTELDKLKSHFLTSVSHELRTPLTSVLGFASLTRKYFRKHFAPLAKDDPNLEHRSTQILDNLEVIEVEGARLTRLINDVLDLNHIESGSRLWRDKQVFPKEALESALRSTAMLFEIKPEVAVSTYFAEDIPPIRVDADALQQVLVNLLHNAANYTERGTVEITISRLQEAGRDMVLFSIQDSGPGIRKEDADKLFRKLTQLQMHTGSPDTLAGSSRGTGLGLAICREIVAHYGGKIWVESENWHGSAFHFTIPADLEGDAPPAPPGTPANPAV